MAGQRGGLLGDPFHQVTVSADRVDVVVEQLRTEGRLLPEAGHRHADRGGHALTERPCGRLDPDREV